MASGTCPAKEISNHLIGLTLKVSAQPWTPDQTAQSWCLHLCATPGAAQGNNITNDTLAYRHSRYLPYLLQFLSLYIYITIFDR